MAQDSAIVGSLVIEQEVDNTKLEKGLKEGVSKVESAAGKIKSALAIAGLAFAFKGATEAAKNSTLATDKFNASLKQVGASVTDFKELTKFQKMATTNFGISGRELKTANAELLRLTGNAKAVQNLQQAMVDMSKGMDLDLTGTAEIINRALGNGLSALSRYGIKATDEMNEHWDEMGNDMEAKSAYLAELLEGRFAGSAKTFGDSTAGQLKRVQLQFASLRVELGKMLLPVFLAIANAAS